jgi:hypothetical protein
MADGWVGTQARIVAGATNPNFKLCICKHIGELYICAVA